MFRYPSLPLCLLILFAGLLLFSRCTYDPDEEFFNELEMPDSSALNIAMDTVLLARYEPGETIHVFGSTTFIFQINGKHGTIEALDVTLEQDGESLIISNSLNQSFTIDKDLFDNGPAILKVKTVVKSGSGSLADKLGQEKFTITQQWVLHVDVTPPPQPALSQDIEDGFLTLRWEK